MSAYQFNPVLETRTQFLIEINDRKVSPSRSCSMMRSSKVTTASNTSLLSCHRSGALLTPILRCSICTSMRYCFTDPPHIALRSKHDPQWTSQSEEISCIFIALWVLVDCCSIASCSHCSGSMPNVMSAPGGGLCVYKTPRLSASGPRRCPHRGCQSRRHWALSGWCQEASHAH